MAQDEWSERSRTLGGLIGRVALGDRAAFASLYRETSGYLFGVVLRIQPHRGLAEELLQDVYVSLWRAAQSFDASRAQPLTWLTTVARHRAIDSLRRDRGSGSSGAPPPETSDEEGDTDPGAGSAAEAVGPVELLEQAAMRQQVAHCVGDLSAEQRQCVALAYYQGLSHAEVAVHLARPLGTVKSAIRRALIALRDCLSRGGILEPS